MSCALALSVLEFLTIRTRLWFIRLLNHNLARELLINGEISNRKFGTSS